VDPHAARVELRQPALRRLDLEKQLVHGPFIISPFIIVIAD